jgi:Zn-dependent peptidase ImmA (M78 family)/DNA-binding XRE family transcriptional regulator
MVLRPLDSWEDVGRRVAAARESARLTQEALASRIELDRTALAKIELGRRGLSSLELARVARELDRPIEWFVAESPPSVVSRRAAETASANSLDVVVDAWARDVELLLELKALQPHDARVPSVPADFAEAEAFATAIRQEIAVVRGPIGNLAGVAERLGLYVVSLDLGTDLPDGAYVAIEGAGATVINGSHDAGRRRFTLAHELGHHVMADEYATDWSLIEGTDERERRINAFAIHFLLPRESAVRDWKAWGGPVDSRPAAVRIAAEYRLSWTAVCTQLETLELVDRQVGADLRRRPPTRLDLTELGVFVVEELAPPSVSPEFSRAVKRAYVGQKITASRATELLRGTAEEHDLPAPEVVPLDALRGDITSPA